ncbi:MAG: Sec-independent protein translocase protein TatB [Mycobacteriaceae bacterium]|uniref:Sec-independent protein translocase protein TatB n=1 Tax=Corynebacterium sp. TaxID=1720 RepID=UPI003F9B3708
MFSSVGWGEILVVIIVGIVVVGPERLPRLINDVKALLLAARRTVSNARKEFDEDFGEDFEEFRKPLNQLNSVRQMGARGFITKTLLDDDDSFLSDFEDSAREVTGAFKGTADAVRHPVRETSPDKGAPATGAASGTSSGTVSGGTSGATGEPAEAGVPAADAPAESGVEVAPVEEPVAQASEPHTGLPRQGEAGRAPDWTDSRGYDDAM